MARTADVTIIGGGPIGLFGLYCAGLNCLSAQLLERLDRVGGQLEYLYPEKPIYDIGGFPKITGRELVEQLKVQALQYPGDVITGVQAEMLESTPTGHRIHTNKGVYESRVVIVTAGIGEFIPRRMNVPAIDQFEGRGLYYVVDDLSHFDGQNVLVVGGGDSAADWAMAIADRARHVTMIHRRSQFQCHRDSLRKLESHPHVSLNPNRALTAVIGGDKVAGALVQNVTGPRAEEPLDVTRIIVAIGLIPGTAAFQQWGLPMEGGNEIRVATDMSTNRPGVYAAGDIATYPGKVKLIAAGFGEVATAMESALKHLEAVP
jgi:thioredoxin reductase